MIYPYKSADGEAIEIEGSMLSPPGEVVERNGKSFRRVYVPPHLSVTPGHIKGYAQPKRWRPALDAGASLDRNGTVVYHSRAQQMEAMVPQFARAMPKHMDPDRLARIAMTEYRRNPVLGTCSPQSFFGALMQAAQLGLEPGLVGHSYLVPFRNKKTGTTDVQFIIG